MYFIFVPLTPTLSRKGEREFLDGNYLAIFPMGEENRGQFLLLQFRASATFIWHPGTPYTDSNLYLFLRA
jgi:hypothetical protein